MIKQKETNSIEERYFKNHGGYKILGNFVHTTFIDTEGKTWLPLDGLCIFFKFKYKKEKRDVLNHPLIDCCEIAGVNKETGEEMRFFCIDCFSYLKWIMEKETSEIPKSLRPAFIELFKEICNAINQGVRDGKIKLPFKLVDQDGNPVDLLKKTC